MQIQQQVILPTQNFSHRLHSLRRLADEGCPFQWARRVNGTKLDRREALPQSLLGAPFQFVRRVAADVGVKADAFPHLPAQQFVDRHT